MIVLIFRDSAPFLILLLNVRCLFRNFILFNCARDSAITSVNPLFFNLIIFGYMNYFKIHLVKLIIKFCYQQRKPPLKVVDLPNYVRVLFPRAGQLVWTVCTGSQQPIEEGWREKQRQRSSPLFGGRIFLTSCRGRCFVSVDLEEKDELQVLYQIDRGKTASAAKN